MVVNQTTGDAQTAPAIAMTDAGSFVVAWQSKGQDGGGEGTYARLFDAAASPLTGEFRANVTTAGTSCAPDVAMDDSGAFVVAWQSDGPGRRPGRHLRPALRCARAPRRAARSR